MALQQDITQPYLFLNSYVQRFSSTFGINTSPTNVELQLVPGHVGNSYDENLGSTGFNFALAQPGKMSGLQIGEFQFAGIIESYEENYGTAGQTYTVRMSDPRILFDSVQIVLDGARSFETDYINVSGLRNYMDILHYFNDAQAADINANGVTWAKIREFLSVSAYGLVYGWGNNFQVLFSSGFQDFGTSNLIGIPKWYRINSDRASLSELIQSVAEAFNKDWYAYVDYDQYVTNPTGIQRLIVKSIERSDAANSTAIENIINEASGNNTLVSYRKGKELRSEPNSLVLHGSKELQWKSVASGDMERFWGFDRNYGIALTTPFNSPSGIVLLDHIVGERASGITSTVNIAGTSYIKNANIDVYPPSIVPSSVNENVVGYYTNNNILDAALYSQETWETVLFYENSGFANQIGIVDFRYLPYTRATSLVNTYIQAGGLGNLLTLGLENTGSGITNRPQDVETLIGAVYDATREIASNNYGKTWLCRVTPSRRTRAVGISTTGFYGTQLSPQLDFNVTDSAWLDPSSTYPDYLPNTLNLFRTNNSSLKTNDGRVRAFGIIPSGRIPLLNPGWVGTGPIDFTIFDRNSVIVEEDKLIFPVSVERYDLDPFKAIVTTPVPIQTYPLNVSGYDQQRAFWEFLNYMGYPQNIIVSGLLDKPGENFNYGFAPPRAQYIEDDITAFLGLAVPIQSEFDSYGPFMKISPTGAGVRVINDESFNPWTYGGIEKMQTAGYQIVTSNITQANIIDSATFTLAGLPGYNIGDNIGGNNNITALTSQIGPDGFTTNYTIRTFALPPFKTSKFLRDSIASNFNDRTSKRELIDLNKLPNTIIDNININKPSQIKNTVNQTQKNTHINNNKKAALSNSYFIGSIDPSGKYNDVVINES